MKRLLHQSVPNKSRGEVYKGPTTKKVYDGQQFKSEEREKSEYVIMKEVKKRRNVKLYNHYLSESAKRKNLSLAKSLFHSLLDQGLSPNEFTYTCLINACSRCFNIQDAEMYLREMQNTLHLHPNEITWTAIIKGASSLFNIQKAQSFLNEMIASGVAPNTRTFNTILRACFRTGDIETAKTIFSQMSSIKMEKKKKAINGEERKRKDKKDGKEESILSSSKKKSDENPMEEGSSFPSNLSDSKDQNQSNPKFQIISCKPDTTTLLAMTQIQAQSMQIIQASDTLDRLETMIEQKNRENSEENHYSIDPSLYLLMASVSLLSGLALKRVKHFMSKYEGEVAELERKGRNIEIEKKLEEKDSMPLIAPEMVMEATYLREIIQRNEGFPKNVTALSKKGPRESSFVKQFIIQNQKSYDSSMDSKDSMNHDDSQKTSIETGDSENHLPSVSNGYLWIEDDIIGEKKPRKLEICSGSGDWMIGRAKMDDAKWAGIEIRFDRVHEIWRKVLLNRLEDRITVIHGDACHIEEMIPKGTIDEIFINFPDPPHTRWSPQRMVTPSLLKSLASILIPGGSITIATDDFDYIRWIKEDSLSLPSLFDSSRSIFSRELNDYGTSYFDGLWSSRGRTDRAKLTIFTHHSKDLI